MSDDRKWEDYIAIRNLIGRLNEYADAANGHSYSELYVDDGVFEIAGHGTHVGRQAIAKVCEAMKVTVHVTTDHVIEIDGDEAHQRSRLLAFYLAQDGSANNFVTSGRYLDQLIRTDAGWRIKHRKAITDLNQDEVLERMNATEVFGALKNI